MTGALIFVSLALVVNVWTLTTLRNRIARREGQEPRYKYPNASCWLVTGLVALFGYGVERLFDLVIWMTTQ